MDSFKPLAFVSLCVEALIISGSAGIVKNATKTPENAYPVMIRARESGRRRICEGPFKKVTTPRQKAEVTRMTLLSIRLGKH